MKQMLLLIAVLAALTMPATAGAACFADYKAKKDDPLRLHYGVMDLPPRACDNDRIAERIVARRIGRDDWILLTIMSVFDEDGLAEREESAGPYFLHY